MSICLSIDVCVVQVAASYGPAAAAMYGAPPLQPAPVQRSSVADMFVAGDFSQRLQHNKMFDFDMRGYLGSVRHQPLPGTCDDDDKWRK